MVDFNRLEELRTRRPLLHCIPDPATAADCAQLALALGADPVLTQAPEETADITARSQALILGTGTPDSEKLRAAMGWGQAAAAAETPIVLAPVGVSLSRWRLQSVHALLHLFTPAILQVSMAETLALLQKAGAEKGEKGTVYSVEERAEAARALARYRRTAVLLSGPTDVVSDGTDCWAVPGVEVPTLVSDSAMLATLCGAFAAVEPEPSRAALLAAACWKLCASRAAAVSRGPGSFRAALLDEAAALTAPGFAAGAEITPL